MFKHDSDRHDYSRLLKAPTGYHLDKAVGTTYSLDLDMLTYVAYSLGLGELSSIVKNDNQIGFLNAISKVTEKVVLFYEAGHLQIRPQNKNGKLYQLLEKMTIPVALPSIKGNHDYPSFHPKTWLLCYKKKDVQPQSKEYKKPEGNKNKKNTNEDKPDYIYRFIVMSRNLTYSREWDIVVSFEGKIKENEEKLNEKEEIDDPNVLQKDKPKDKAPTKPIADFLEFLSTLAQPNPELRQNDPRYEIVESLRKEIANVRFDIGNDGNDDKGFKEVRFMPIGLENEGHSKWELEKDKWLGKRHRKFDQIAIMSPFISKKIIERFNEKWLNSVKVSKEGKEDKDNFPWPTLITRATEIKELKNIDDFRFHIYTLKNDVIDGETSLEDDNPQEEKPSPCKQDIHAKILMFSKGNDTHIYMGSMNASEKGFHRNIEFDVCLRHNSSKNPLTPEVFLKEIGIEKEMPSKSPFMERKLSDYIEKESDGKSVDLDMKRLCRSIANGIVEEQKNEKNGDKEQLYMITLFFDEEIINRMKSHSVTIKPISEEVSPIPMEKVTVFEGLKLKDITQYFIIEFNNEKDEEGNPNPQKRIIQIPLKGIPQERERVICSSVINKKEALYAYISLVLSNDKLDAMVENSMKRPGEGKSGYKAVSFPGIYEKLLEAAVSKDSRERFKELDEILQLINKDDKDKNDDPNNKDDNFVNEFNTLYKVYKVFCDALEIEGN